MGADVGLKVRILNQNNEEKYLINVSDQDNSLMSLFLSSGAKTCQIEYTNIKVDRESILNREENEMFMLDNADESGEVMATEIVSAKEALKVLEKLYWQIDLISRKIQNNHLKEVDSMDITDENKDDKKIRINMEYSGFNHSFSTLLGIIKTAAKMDFKIQIVSLYY